MTRRTRVILASIVLASIAGAAWAETWRTYVNPRFGVSAQVPSDWTMGPEPANDDGRAFTAPDGSAEIIVSGILSTLSRDQEFSIRTAPNPGETISYKAVRGAVVVVSGTRADKIFYRKSVLNCGIWNDVSIEYPAVEKAKYDVLVVHVAASLEPGRGYSRRPCP
jgi:serine/threonine-protein kinase